MIFIICYLLRGAPAARPEKPENRGKQRPAGQRRPATSQRTERGGRAGQWGGSAPGRAAGGEKKKKAPRDQPADGPRACACPPAVASVRCPARDFPSNFSASLSPPTRFSACPVERSLRRTGSDVATESVRTTDINVAGRTAAQAEMGSTFRYQRTDQYLIARIRVICITYRIQCTAIF